MGLPLRGKPPRSPQMGNVAGVPKPRVRRTTFARRSSGSVQPAGSLLILPGVQDGHQGRLAQHLGQPNGDGGVGA